MFMANQLVGFGAGGPVPALLSTSGLTKIGNMTAAGGLAAAFDLNEDQAQAACAYNSGTTAGTVGVDWGAGITKTVTQATVISSNNEGWDAAANSGLYDFTLQGSTDNFSASTVDLGSTLGQAEGGTSKQTVVVTAADLTAYRYHRMKITKQGGGSMAITCAELKLTGY